MRFFNFLLLMFSLAALGSCTEAQLVSHVAKTGVAGQPKQEGSFKVGKPYRVDGKWYTPKETYNYTETGIASWYGAEFHGKKTANGEIFDMNELTAAHRTLQMPSLVRVTNLENGRSLIVRVNDRGPFKRGRVIDLSSKAADLLGFKGNGTAKVKLQVLSEESQRIAMAARRGEDTRGFEVAMNETRQPRPYGVETSPPVLTSPPQTGYQTASYETVESAPLQPPPPVTGHINPQGNFMPDPVVQQMPVTATNIYVQTGSFGEEANALRLAESLKRFGNARVYPAQVNGSQFYRVRLGPVPTVNHADALLADVAGAGHREAIIVVE